MTHADLSQLPAADLFRLFSGVLDQLRERGLVRSTNNPVADYAEWLATKALDLTLAGKSASGHDAEDSEGRRYQVKARRLTPHNSSRQLSFMRNMESRPFDFLVGVLFDVNFNVYRACLVPFEVVQARSAFTKHVNAHRFVLRDDVWAIAGVRDLTPNIAAAALLADAEAEVRG